MLGAPCNHLYLPNSKYAPDESIHTCTLGPKIGKNSGLLIIRPKEAGVSVALDILNHGKAESKM